MQIGQPSLTARSAAAHRAAHQILERGLVFRDPLAIAMLGETAEAIALDAGDDPAKRLMRLFIAVRSRFAEDAVADAAAEGVRQLVVLGAGLDTFAYRNPHAGLHVFEVDHPDTQQWKRRRLAEATIASPDSLTFAPVDFEREDLADALAAAGFDAGQPAFFSWLGVVPYLSEAAIFGTLAMIGRLPAGTRVVFDYGDPPSTLPPERRAMHESRAARVAALGESWISHFEPEPLAERLHGLGFASIRDLGPRQIVETYFPMREPPASNRGGHVILAKRS